VIKTRPAPSSYRIGSGMTKSAGESIFGKIYPPLRPVFYGEKVDAKRTDAAQGKAAPLQLSEFLRQLALGVAPRHFTERDNLFDFRSLPCRVKLIEALCAQFHHRLHRRL
jgi:hypothetical protein